MHLATRLPSALAIVRGNESANERPEKLENIENLERFWYAARLDRKVPPFKEAAWVATFVCIVQGERRSAG